MNKTELVSAIAESTGVSKAQVGQVVDGFIDAVKAGVSKGDKITIPGFMTIEVKDTPARTGRNPATGAELNIPAGKAVKLRVGKTLKDAAA